MLELKRTVYKFDVYGTPVELSAPKVRQYKEFENKLKSGKNEFDMMVSFLVSLGMNEELVNDLESSHILDIIDHISKGEKEKK